MLTPRRASLVPLLILLLAGGCGRETVAPGEPLARFIEHLDQRIPRLMDRYDVPGLAIAIVRGGEPVWSAAYGMADIEQQRTMTVDAVFRAESISKAVTAWGVMRLVEQGRISLDDPVDLHLSDFRLHGSNEDVRGVTIRRLLSHTAGLPLGPVGPPVQFAPGTEMPSLREFLAPDVHPVREPGSGYLYSNVGFNLLELVVEEVTGSDFAGFMADQVLRPLGMLDSGFDWNAGFAASIATGYDLRGEPVPTYVYPARASGGLFTTVDDLARFVAAGMHAPGSLGDRVLSPDGIRALQSEQVEVSGAFGIVADAYGMGHFLERSRGGEPVVWVGGQGNGWMSDFHAVPGSGAGIVILTNSQKSWPLMAEVLNDWSRWTGIAPVKWVRIAHGITALWAVVGLIVAVTLWQSLRLAIGLSRRERRWAPLAADSRTSRGLRATAALTVIAALSWSAAQPYLMISSVFSGVTRYAGIALLGLTVVALASALCPRFTRARSRGRRIEGAGREQGERASPSMASTGS